MSRLPEASPAYTTHLPSGERLGNHSMPASLVRRSKPALAPAALPLPRASASTTYAAAAITSSTEAVTTSRLRSGGGGGRPGGGGAPSAAANSRGVAERAAGALG